MNNGQIKRYDVQSTGAAYDTGPYTEEVVESDGKYVKYDDIAHLLAAPVVAALPSSNDSMMKWALRELISSLPQSRDWLNPDAEKILRDALVATPAQPADQGPGLSDERKHEHSELVITLRQLSDAYPVEVWPELTEAQRDEMGVLLDRASAAMGRKMSKVFTRAADALDALIASAGVPAAPDEFVGKWGYAAEGAENYNGMYDSEGDARAAAEAELSPGTTYSVGNCTHPIEMIRGRAKHIGDDIVERVDEQTYDEVGGDEPAVELSDEDKERLGLLVLDFIKREGSAHRWGVKNISTYKT